MGWGWEGDGGEGAGQEGRGEFANEKSYHTHLILATCSFGDYSTTGC